MLLNRLISGVKMIENGCSKLKETSVELIQFDKWRKESEKKNEKGLQDMWNNSKISSICVIRVPEKGVKEGGDKRVFEKSNG